MPTTKSYTFYFWQIQRGAGVFERLLKNAASISELSRRVRLIGEYRLRYEQLDETHKGFYCGDITKFRDGVIPNKAAPNTKRRPVPLERDESTTEDTAFGYHAGSNILITQANHFGSTAAQIVRYFARLSDHEDLIYPDPMLSEEGWQRLDSMSLVKKFTYAIQPGKRYNPREIENLAVGRALQTMQDTGGRRVKIEVSVGHAKTGLIREQIKSVASSLMQLFDGNKRQVPKLEVVGLDEADQRDSFDLLEYRVRQDIPIEIQGRAATDAQRINALKEAYRRCAARLPKS